MNGLNQSWMLPREAINFILERVEPGAIVVEFGSGHGSEILAKHCELYSIEHDEAWLNLTSSRYIHAPIQENSHSTKVGERGWYDVGRILESWPSDIQCIVVDGPPGFIGRTGILSLLNLLKNVPMILIDDVDRLPEMNLAKHLAERMNFDIQVCDVEKPREGGTVRRYAVLTRGA